MTVTYLKNAGIHVPLRKHQLKMLCYCQDKYLVTSQINKCMTLGSYDALAHKPTPIDAENCPLIPGFRRATAGFPLFCLEILSGWLTSSHCPVDLLLGLEERHCLSSSQTVIPKG